MNRFSSVLDKGYLSSVQGSLLSRDVVELPSKVGGSFCQV
jgi:hypothetical protein